MASADRDLLDRHRVRGGRLVPGTFTARRRAALARDRGPSAVRGVRAGLRCQPARRMVGDEWSARRLVVLVRQPGLGIPGDRSLLAVSVGGRFAGLVCDSVVAGAATHSGRSAGAPVGPHVPVCVAGDSGVLPAGAVLRCQDQFHRRRHLALLDHPPVGGRLLRILRHHGRCATVLFSSA